ncbi:MAG: diguanylate cyclase [Planctomycetota bacterium]
MPEANPLRVLIVDDDPLSLRLLDTYLTNSGYGVLTAANGVEAMQILLAQGPPMIITNWMMPEMDGLELCRNIRAHEGVSFAYIIMVTAHSGKDRIVQAFSAGADDFLPKPFNRKELLARVRAGSRIVQLQDDLDRRNLEVHRVNAEMALAHSKLHDANEKLRLMATTDELTGLVNRRAALERLHENWVSADRHDEPLACVMLDIDHFKSVNDTFGHAIGDVALKETAEVMRSAARIEEHLSRIGGEEFLLVCPKTSEDGAAMVAERLRRAVQSHTIKADQKALTITVSLGVAERSPDMLSPDDLLIAADRALYAAKRGGRNRVCLAGECEEEAKTEESPADVPPDSPSPTPVPTTPD